MRESEDRCQDLQDKFSLQKQEFDGLAREKEGIEVHCVHLIFSENWLQQLLLKYSLVPRPSHVFHYFTIFFM